MGKSAKFLKRTHKLKSTSQSSATNTNTTSIELQIQASKKKDSLKSKPEKFSPRTRSSITSASKSTKHNPKDKILGGVDYVSLLLGGRRKAREEATRLPKHKSEDKDVVMH